MMNMVDNGYWTIDFISRIASYDTIISNQRFNWNKKVLSSRKDVVRFLKHYDLIDRNTISLNHMITPQIIKNNNHIHWNHNLFAMNNALIKENDLYKNYYLLSNNSALNTDMILENIDKPWVWHSVSRSISLNLELHSKIWMSVRKIQRFYNMVAYDPSFIFSKKVILRHHKQLCIETAMLLS